MRTDPQSRSRENQDAIRAVTDRRVLPDRIPLMQDLVRGKRVLDIGCVEHSVENRERPDWVHGRLKETAAELLGLDYEVEDVRRMCELGFEVVAADATDFDLGRTFDVVVAGEVLEHLLNDQGFLASVRRHLKPGGQLVITVPHANSLNYFLQNLFFGYEIDGYDHVSFYTAMNLANLLRKSGYQLQRVVYLQPDTAGHHTRAGTRILVRIARVLQRIANRIRPSLARQIMVVATPAPPA